MTQDSFKLFISQWVTPFTLVIAFGAVVWGIQLNYATLQNTKRLGAQAAEIRLIRDQDISANLILVRATLLQDQLEKRLVRVERAQAVHDKEAEAWKRKIIKNESRLSRRDSGDNPLN